MIDPELQGASPLLAPEMIFFEISPKNELDSSNSVFVSDLFGTYILLWRESESHPQSSQVMRAICQALNDWTCSQTSSNISCLNECFLLY